MAFVGGIDAHAAGFGQQGRGSRPRRAAGRATHLQDVVTHIQTVHAGNTASTRLCELLPAEPSANQAREVRSSL